MSFASSAREEIAQRSPTKECCVRAAAYGIACFAKYFDARGLVLQTEQPHTVQLAQQLFARCGIRGEILEKPRVSGVLYEFNIRDAEQVTRLHELFGTTGRETSLQIDPGSSVARPASVPISPWPFCAAARSPTRKRNITWNFSPPGRTSPGILKRCWPSTSLRPTAPAATA